jgi:translation initiation factor eIF-2B subunit delta
MNESFRLFQKLVNVFMSYNQNEFLSQLTKEIDAQQENEKKTPQPKPQPRTRTISIKGDAKSAFPPKSPVMFEQITRTTVVEDPKKKKKEKQEKGKKEGGMTKEQRQELYDNQTKQKQEKQEKKKTTSTTGTSNSVPSKQKTERFYTHIQEYISEENKKKLPVNNESIHPVIIKFAYEYAQDQSYVGNQMAVKFLKSFQTVIMEYDPKEKSVEEITYFQTYKTLYESINAMIGFIVEQRPLTTSLASAIAFFKNKLTTTDKNLTLSEAKEEICEAMDAFIHDRIELSVKDIINHGTEIIKESDVIMIYSRFLFYFSNFFSCSTVESILIAAHSQGKKFRVIVVDSRPNHEGRRVLSNLSSVGIKCTFINLSAISYMMKETTKVLIGASCMLSNGFAVARIGTASLALIADTFNIPFIVCCETYKFSEKIYLDSSTNNELGNEKDLLKIERQEQILTGNEKNIHLLNLIYDVTPKEFIHVVLTDVGLIPSTSVPVVIREYKIL